MKRIPIEVQEDYLQRLSRPSRPLQAVEELIWNALDADAAKVTVHIGTNELDGVEWIEVRDDGHGMSPDETERAFHNLGGSWKRSQLRSRSGERVLHGKSGEGRFRAFALGEEVRWETVAQHEGRRTLTVITGRLSTIREFELSDPLNRPGIGGGSGVP